MIINTQFYTKYKISSARIFYQYLVPVYNNVSFWIFTAVPVSVCPVLNFLIPVIYAGYLVSGGLLVVALECQELKSLAIKMQGTNRSG